MVQWGTLGEILHDAKIYNNLGHALFGLYTWEFLLSLDYEWDLIQRRRKFRLPVFFYLLGRYAVLGAMIGQTIGLNWGTRKMDCQALTSFDQIMGGIAIATASLNLALRTIAIWKQHRAVIALVVVLSLGHWFIVFRGIYIKSRYVPYIGCEVIHTDNKSLAAMYAYGMGFDLIIMILSLWKLAWSARGHNSALVQLLFHDGLIFFCVAFTANLLTTIFVVLRLNVIMTLMFDAPATVITTIAACRAVRRLSNFNNNNNNAATPLTFSRPLTALKFRSPSSTTGTGQSSTKQLDVRVEMDTFVAADRVETADQSEDLAR